MTDYTKEHPWVWIIVQNPGADEKILGQQDQQTNTVFLPVFLTKEDALTCFMHFTRGSEFKFEVQAILYTDLIEHARENNFQLFIINGKGEIIDRVTP